jgi:type IV pilus assembly protein PilC
MLLNPSVSPPKEAIYEWEGTNEQGSLVRGQMSAMGPLHVMARLRGQGVQGATVAVQMRPKGRPIKPGDITAFTRQLATMLKSGVPLMQCFDVMARDQSQGRMSRLLNEIRAEVETGTSLSAAFRRHPAHFNRLYCNLVAAGETAGILDALLDRLALHMEKTEALKRKVKSALTYPAAVLTVACLVVAVIMIFVIPSFKSVFASFGADLPAPTLVVMAASEFLLAWWWLIVGAVTGGAYLFMRTLKSSEKLQARLDSWVLTLPIFGELIEKACIARWTRTLSTMFAAGVPLLESLESAGGTSGNSVYALATARIQQEVSKGISLNAAMRSTGVFPAMVLQMCMIGEESGSLDAMLGKAADFFENEVDMNVAALSSLMEPLIIATLGTLIGGIVVSMYLPIFKLGQVI